MDDHFDIEPQIRKAAEKTGGAFKMTVLLQKRLKSLNAGAQKLVDVTSNDRLKVAFAEIMQDKITLDQSESDAPAAKKAASKKTKKKDKDK